MNKAALWTFFILVISSCIAAPPTLPSDNVEGSDLGNTCEHDVQCTVKTNYAVCKVGENGQKTCECGDDYVSYNTKCYRVSDLGSACEYDVQCSAKTNSAVCEVDVNSSYGMKSCVCQSGYVKHANQCYPVSGLKSTCEYDEQCIAKHSECTTDHFGQKTCSCKKYYIHHKGKCYPVAQLGYGCKYNKQCSAMTENAVCKSTETHGKVCDCVDGYVNKQNECYKDSSILGTLQNILGNLTQTISNIGHNIINVIFG